MNGKYDQEEWATTTTRGRQVFNYGYVLTGSELRGWKLLKTVSMQEGRDFSEKAYIWEDRGDPKAMVRVSITERHSWKLAQESLHRHLIECMRADIPKGAGELGDVNYTAREPQTDTAGAISFTRGNVCVAISSVGEKNMDVSEIAAALDRALSEPPAEAEAGRRPLRARVPKSVDVSAGKSVVLVEKLSEAVPRGGWLKVIVPDGELHRKGDALMYVSPQGGKKSVSAFAAKGY